MLLNFTDLAALKGCTCLLIYFGTCAKISPPFLASNISVSPLSPLTDSSRALIAGITFWLIDSIALFPVFIGKESGSNTCCLIYIPDIAFGSAYKSAANNE
jgi:hypothetical protein